MRPGRWTRCLAAAGAAATVAACSSIGRPAVPAPAPDSAVVVASFNFPESELIAEIYAQSLEHAGIPVHRELDLGPRELIRPAQRRGLVDVVPEYLGTALTGDDSATEARFLAPSLMLAQLRRAVSGEGLAVLAPSAAQDQNGLAVTAATARRYDLRTVSDLRSVAPRLTLGGASECPRRPLCLPGLGLVYGIAFRAFLPFDDVGQRATALTEGVIDVEVTFTTDPRLAEGSFVLLQDDAQLQPPENLVPMVSDRALHRYGDRLRAALDSVSSALDSRALTFLNWRVGLAGKHVQDEARGWLRRHGLLT